MILGLLSDTHGQPERAARAIALLREKGASAFIHCGDVCSEGVLDALAGLQAWVVWGNCDLPEALRHYAASLGLPTPTGIPLRLRLDDKRIAVFHGHEREFTAVIRIFNEPNGQAGLPDIDYVF